MAESRGVTPLQFGGDIGEFLQLPGDEPPFRNYTLGSTAASPANRRWFLPPVERNGNDSLGSSTVNHRYITILYSIYTPLFFLATVFFTISYFFFCFCVEPIE